jgi:hypothetical protein
VRYFLLLPFALVLALILRLSTSGTPIHSDFGQFYSAASMVRDGRGNELYNPSLQAKYQAGITPNHVFYFRPPFHALAFVPFTLLSCHAGSVLWTALSLLFFCTTIWLIWIQGASIYAIGLALVACVVPMLSSLMLGQDSAFTVLIYAGAFSLITARKDFLAGCVLACGLYKPQLIIPFVIILMMRRNWGFLKGFALTALALGTLSIAVSGWQTVLAYPGLLLLDPGHRQVGTLGPILMPNLRGLLYLFVHAERLRRLLLVGISASVLAVPAMFWNEERRTLSSAIAVSATLILSYYMYGYDLAIYLLPLALIFESALRSGVFAKFAMAMIAVCLIPPLHSILFLRGLYSLETVPLVLAFALGCFLLKTLERSQLAVGSAAAISRMTVPAVPLRLWGRHR